MKVKTQRLLRTMAAASAALVLAACAGTATGSPGAGNTQQVKLGYFPNLTHAPAIVGVDRGYFAKHLGGTVLTPVTFNAGPAAIEALFSGAVDMAFVGPNPTVNGFVKSKGEALRVVAGAASGGAGLVVRAGITSPSQLRGAKLASPQLGNTQDVALRHWLKVQGLATDPEGGGDVHILPQENATALQAFAAGSIDGAWLPEPWMTRLLLEGGAHVLVNEKDLWPGGKFVVTNLVVRKDFLDKHPQTVAAVLEGELDAIDFINSSPTEAKTTVNTGLKNLTGKEIKPELLDRAWTNVSFTADPLAATLKAGAANAQSLGLLATVDLKGLYDLGPLNAALKARGKAPVVQP